MRPALWAFGFLAPADLTAAGLLHLPADG